VTEDNTQLQEDQHEDETEGPLPFIQAMKDAVISNPDISLKDFVVDYLEPVLQEVIDDYSIQLEDIESLVTEGGDDDQRFQQALRLIGMLSSAVDLLMQHGGYINAEGLTEAFATLPEPFKELYGQIAQEIAAVTSGNTEEDDADDGDEDEDNE
jgi:hypothetical protein